MTAINASPRTAAQINARRSEIGAELAKGRIVPVANARALEAEDATLKIEYVGALQRESEAARDAADIDTRVESARREKLAVEREARIKQAVAAATQ